ncbi:MAG: 3-dehydroquinate synthase [Anaeromicrobium sp.]|jgi:3-dehydroquinate synthase|uniref:3-dehydroquinate synthase n=1 Tax=Anaeromicrobium sp. TaxID=1929132 RepID=UPI0025F2D979|nr:3-dehydroquinate synthase [Anaeromicrobium sp.]MCT4595364.1 3-dehydroquinate synthase [Anaeromicrobium sp.]
MLTLNVNAKSRQYKINIKRGILEKLGEHIKLLYKGKKVVVITDTNVSRLYKEKIDKTLSEYFQVHFIEVEPGESSKSFKTMEICCEKLANLNITRSDLIVAFGGGVVGDLAGFISATYLRGVDFIQVPTTLLSQVDSSVGGKVAINLKSGKNLVGNFYQPKAVLIDPDLLCTLDGKYFSDGMAEVIKYGCIRDEKLFNTLKECIDINEIIEEIIYTCCEIKAEVVGEDELDKGIRMILNFGHTIGHGIERVFDYKKYSHGEAVAIGMYVISKSSEKLGLTKMGTRDEIKNLLEKYNLPYELPITDEEDLIDAIKKDKKSTGEYVNIILLKEIGDCYIKKIKSSQIKDYI